MSTFTWYSSHLKKSDMEAKEASHISYEAPVARESAH